MDIIAVWLIDFFSFLQDRGMYCMKVTSLFRRAEFSPFCDC